MPRWQFFVTPEAEQNMDALDMPIQTRVVGKLHWLVEHFDDIVPLPLGGPWRGFFKLRVGDWRVIYEIESEQERVIVHHIGKRDEVYRQKR